MQESIQKDKTVVFQRKLSYYKERPGQHSRYLIKRNLKDLVQRSCADAAEFTHTVEVKRKALGQLRHAIILAEETISEHFETIARNLIRLFGREDNRLNDDIKNTSEVLGVYVDSFLYVPVMIKILSEEETRVSPKLTANSLEIFACLAKNETQDSIKNELTNLIKIIQDVENAYNENIEVMLAGYRLVTNLIVVLKEWCSGFRSQFFSYFLTIESIQNIDPVLKQNIKNFIRLLGEFCGYQDVKDLYAVEVNSTMKEFFDAKSFEKWDNHSKERFKFDIIVRNCGKGLAEVLDIVLLILETMVATKTELEMKIDALDLIKFLMEVDDLSEQLKHNAFRIMSKILVPCGVWKHGKPYIKIRKAAVICMIHFVKMNLINPEDLFKNLSDLKPVLKNCLNEDWGPDLRHVSCSLLECLFISMKDILPDTDLKDLYPHLLERLDDSQDLVRIEITKSIRAFFKCTQLRASTILKYVVETLLIHLDDKNEELKLALFNVLKEAAEQDPKVVLDQARISVNKHKNPRFCQELIRWIEENLHEKLKDIQEKLRLEEEERNKEKMNEEK